MVNMFLAMCSIAEVVLYPSVNDVAIPMVNQSLACGTSAVAFEMGTALDYVRGRNTGYCARLCDAEDYVHGMEKYSDFLDLNILPCGKSAEGYRRICFLKIDGWQCIRTYLRNTFHVKVTRFA